MPLPTSIHAYADVRAVLDAAAANSGARYRLPTRGKAIRFTQRAYMLRKLLWDQGQATPWDKFVFTIEPKDGEKDAPAAVVIQEREIAKLEDLSGNPIKPALVEDEDDDLLEEAKRLDLRGDLDL